MRCLMKVTIPVVEGNAAIADGSLGSTIGSILADLKPEAAYFTLGNGQRTAFLFINMENSSQLPALAEPFFQTFRREHRSNTRDVPGRSEKRGLRNRKRSEEIFPGGAGRQRINFSFHIVGFPSDRGGYGRLSYLCHSPIGNLRYPSVDCPEPVRKRNRHRRENDDPLVSADAR